MNYVSFLDELLTVYLSVLHFVKLPDVLYRKDLSCPNLNMGSHCETYVPTALPILKLISIPDLKLNPYNSREIYIGRALYTCDGKTYLKDAVGGEAAATVVTTVLAVGPVLSGALWTVALYHTEHLDRFCPTLSVRV